MIFEHFIKNNKPKHVIYFMNKRFNINQFDNLGFNFVENVKPNYYFIMF